jgi:hypothetical protein
MEENDLKVSPNVATFDLDDQSVIFVPHSSTTYVLNPTATHVWKYLTSGSVPRNVAEKLALDFGIPETLARHDVDELIRQWRDTGLLGGDMVDVTATAPAVADFSVHLRNPARKEPLLEQPTYRATFRILDFLFQIGSSDRDIVEEICDLLSHVRASTPVGSEVPTRLFIQQMNNDWKLHEESVELTSCRTKEHLIPVIYTFVLMLSYLRSASFAAIHGAAVSNGSRCVLLPGSSGSGKSTLAAGLVGAGLSCYTDDMAVLTLPPVRLRPLPMRIGLKEGSWPVLADSFPELDDLAVYTRPDGRRVKYLAQACAGMARDEGPVAVTDLVFPKYSVSARNTLKPLSRAAAFSELASAGYDLPTAMTADWVRTMTDWLRGVSCHEIEFDNLDAAIAQINRLLS